MRIVAKQVLSLLLAGSMVLGSSPVMALAADTGAEMEISADALERDRTWTGNIQDGVWTLDETTKWNWVSKYGDDGWVLCGWNSGNDIMDLPYYIDSISYVNEDRSGGYVARSADSEEGNAAWWEYGLPLESDPNGTRKISYHFDDKRQTVKIRANDNDRHIVSFYILSENDPSPYKHQDIQVYKADSDEKIGETIRVTDAMKGKYVSTSFQGSVDIVFTNVNYKALSTNSIINGIFFDTYYGSEIPVRRIVANPVDGETIRTETGTVQMSAALYPEQASADQLVWSVLPEGTDVASVDENGLLTVKKEGKFTVRAQAQNSDVYNDVSMACVPVDAVPSTTEWKVVAEDYVVIQNQAVRVIFDKTVGRYNVYEQSTGIPYVLGAYYQVNDQKSTDGYTFTQEDVPDGVENGKCVRLVGTREGENGLVLDISLEDATGDIMLKAGIRNTSGEGVKVMQMYPMAASFQEKGGIFVGPDPEEHHAVLTGEGNWTVPQVYQDVNVSSKNNLMISYRDNPAVESFLIGQLTTYSFQSTITTSYDPNHTVENRNRKSMDGNIRIYDSTGKLVDAGDTYVGDTALINFTEKNPYDSLEAYAKKQAKVMDVQLIDENGLDPYIYECLWYVNWFTSGANNADFAVQEVKDLYKKGLANYARPCLRVEPDTYVNPNEQLWWDDAHWKQFGHLTDTYPTMKEWLDAMHEAGGEGGTYMQASYRSDDYCEQYPEHMLNNDANEGPDYTDPDFIAHMAEVYTNLKNAGMRSIFYDYAGQYHGASGGYLLDKTGGFEDEHATAVEAYRNIFALPKTYIGRDVRISENSWEYSGSDVAIGLIDIQRNIGDTNKFNPGIAEVGINQWYRHRTTKLLYPDVKVFENDDIDLRRAQITGTAFFFGKMTLGESVNLMSDDKIRDVGRTVPFPINGISTRPVGLFEGEYEEEGLVNPEVLDYKFNSEYDDHILLFWNQTTASKTISANLGLDTAFGGVGLDADKEYDIWDFWDWNYIGRVKGSDILSLPVRRNEMKTMAVREVRNTPYLLSTNRHLLQGTQEIEAKDITWNAENDTLTGTFEIVANDTFKAIVPVAEGLVFKELSFDNDAVDGNAVYNAAGGYVEITLDADKNQSVPFTLSFEEGETPKDTKAPISIANLRATANEEGVVILTWDPSEDESGSVRYAVYGSTSPEFDPETATLVGLTTDTTFSNSNPTTRNYYYTVVAMDAGHNASLPVSVTTKSVEMQVGVSALRATCGNNQGSDTPDHVLDGDPDTLWHTSWNDWVAESDRWIDLHITTGPATIGGVKYLARQGDTANGRFIRCRVEISNDNGRTYTTLISDYRLKNTTEWQTIKFDAPVTVTNVRLYCLESADSNKTKWASAAELRLIYPTEYEGMAMREETATLYPGTEKTMLVDFFPTNFTKALTFSSDNEAVATVDENGVVTALAVGTATITAATEDGETVTCKIEVKDTILSAACRGYEGLDTSVYTAESVEAFEKALKEAKQTLAGLTGMTSEDALAALMKAAAELKLDTSKLENDLEAAKAAAASAQALADTAKAVADAAATQKDYDTLNAAVEAANTAATSAKQAAEAAQKAAGDDAEKIKVLQSTINTVSTAAQTAQTSAAQAREDAEAAQAAADQADERAEEAQTAAAHAKEVADAASKLAGELQAELDKALVQSDTDKADIERLKREAAQAKAAAEAAQAAAKAAQEEAAAAQLAMSRMAFALETVELKTVKSPKKKIMKLTWTPVEGAEGYEIRYGLKASFKKAKKALGKAAAKAKTIKKLKRHKRYYVRVRAYKTIGGVKVYTRYSTVKKVRIK